MGFFVSLLIPDPKSPGTKIDVYLQPLIEELKSLWTFSVCMYDCLTDQCFQLMQPCCGQLMTFRQMETYLDGVWRGIRHVPFE